MPLLHLDPRGHWFYPDIAHGPLSSLTLDVPDGAAQLDDADLWLGVAVGADRNVRDPLHPRLDGVRDVGHHLQHSWLVE